MTWMGKVRSRAFRGGATLIMGSVIAQLVILVTIPILARLYSPESFGYLSLVLAISAIVAPIACLRLESALLLPNTESDASTLFILAAICAVVTSSLSVVCLDVVLDLGFLPKLGTLQFFPLWAGGVGLLTGLFALTSQFVLRDRDYGPVAKRGVYQAVVTAVAQVGLNRVVPGATGLLAGHAIGRSAGIVPLLWLSRCKLRSFRLDRVAPLLRTYWKFPTLFTPATLLNGLGLALPILFIGSAFTVNDAGQWGLADRVLAAPVMLVAGAVGQVIESNLAADYRGAGGRMTSFYLRASAMLGIVGFGLVAGVVGLASLVLPWLFGDGWESAINLIQIMVFATFARLVAGPTAKALIVLQRAGLNLILDAARVVLLLASFIVIVHAEVSLVQAAGIISGVMICVYVATWLVGLVSVKKHDRKRPAEIEVPSSG